MFWCVSSVYPDHYSLDRQCDWCCGDESLHWVLSGASSLLCGCHYPVRGQVCSLVVGVVAPKTISELCFWATGRGRQNWSTPTGRGATEYSSARAVHQWACSVVSPVTHCVGSKSTLLLALSSAPSQPMPAISQVLFSQGYRCRPTDVRSQDCSSCAPGSIVGAMEAAQTLAQPTKPTTIKGRPVPPARAPTVPSDILQVLNLQSQWQRCKSMAHATVGRDFSPASYVAQPLALSCGFSPASAWSQPTGICSCSPPRQQLGLGSLLR